MHNCTIYILKGRKSSNIATSSTKVLIVFALFLPIPYENMGQDNMK